MSILYRWLAADNDDSDWTNDTALGTVDYAGSPLTKNFQKSSGGGFNDLGHYNTDGYAAASGLQFHVFAQLSSGSTTDAFIAGVNRNTSDLGNARNFYISGTTFYVNMGGGSGVNALATNDPSPLVNDQTYHFEQRIRADGGSDFYIDDLEVLSNPGTEGLNYTTGTLRHYANIAQVGGTTGVARWLEAYITDANSFTPPDPVEDAAVANGQTQIDYTFTETGITSTNADYISVEGSDTGGGAGFSEIEQAAVGSGGGSEAGLSAGQTRYYRFRTAVVVDGTEYYSAYSGEVSATTDAAPASDDECEMPVAVRFAAARRGMLRNRGGR